VANNQNADNPEGQKIKLPNISAIAAAIALVAFTVLAPRQALAEWPGSAFAATNVSEAMNNLYDSADNTPSGKIKIIVPDISENGATVPVTVETAMAASAIAIVVEKNPTQAVHWAQEREGDQWRLRRRRRERAAEGEKIDSRQGRATRRHYRCRGEHQPPHGGPAHHRIHGDA
jgi:hypothetical protein